MKSWLVSSIEITSGGSGPTRARRPSSAPTPRHVADAPRTAELGARLIGTINAVMAGKPEVVEVAGLDELDWPDRVCLVIGNEVAGVSPPVIEACEANGITPQDIDLYFFHQANLRINEYVANSLEIPPEKVPNNMQRYGNCSAASIPMLLAEAKQRGELTPGTITSLTGFGSGFTWASAADGLPWVGVSCQVDGADAWWPCKDHPSDEPDEGVDLSECGIEAYPEFVGSQGSGK